MDLVVTVLGSDLKPVAIIDQYESLIWTERYSSCGDFELSLRMSSEALEFLKTDNYLRINDSDHVMVIETIDINNDVENGDHLLVQGRSLESLLDRRIIWKKTTINGSLQNGIRKLLNQNVISPEDPDRTIPNFVFRASESSAIVDARVRAQFTGDNLYDAIKDLCESFGFGFQVILSSDYKFVFSLYEGVDRSFDQMKNARMTFSPEFDNLISSNYHASTQSLRTVALVAGEGEGNSRKKAHVSLYEEEPIGMARRELYVDARDISSQTDEGAEITEDEYNSLLEQRGFEKLLENIVTESFEGEVEPNGFFEYRCDYDKGDIVQIQNEYGITKKMRVTEIVRSQSSEGYSLYPTFVFIE